VRTARPGRKRGADLVLLTDAVVPDQDLVGTLVANAVPHLAVYVRDGAGVVGPLVLPGQSSCLQCANLYRTQADPCWPRIATQLAGAPQLATLACTQATAGFAVAAALDALRWFGSGGERPSTWNATVEIDPVTASTQYRSWPPHPACPCRGPGQLRR
jgi:bacteriocin biosynthesis cyclodehydratase domain-containing protein